MQTCPLLIRVFTKSGVHHSREEFAVRGKEPKDEVQIYTWKDATLGELTDLVKEVVPAARRRNARLSFAIVYHDKSGRFVMKKIVLKFLEGRKENQVWYNGSDYALGILDDSFASQMQRLQGNALQ